MIDLLNTVLGDYPKSWSGVAGAYEVSKLKSFSCNNSREQTEPKAAVIWYVAPPVLSRFGCS